MKRLKVITSHSITRLAASLAEDLARSPASVFERETVVVLNTGMARWISIELAVRQGISAGLDFRFPNQVIDDCFRVMLPDLPANSPFTRDAMTWSIADCLPRLLARPGFEQVAGYLGKSGSDRRLLQFSRTLADLFDQYIIFRPEMVLSWDRGTDNGWQSVLWREFSCARTGQHRAALLESFRARMGAGAPPAGNLPPRISLFGISYLPPFHLDAFSLLAQCTEITFYLQNPCGAYWGDIVSRQRLAELAVQEAPLAEEYYDTGNPLLSSLGTMGQEFHDLLLERGYDTLDLDDEDDLPGQTLLSALQHDIRQLRDSGGRDSTIAIAPEDRSLQVHACHGPLREMEVLYDNLLAMFDELAGLEPRQIVVMIPDIEAYAPYIAAVFGVQSGGRPAIPFTIADRSHRRENPVVETFFRILGLGGSRFEINQILELLESPPVLNRFGLTTGELEDVRRWLRATCVAWGYDARHRTELGFPCHEDFTWSAALKRLMLGYAMAPDGNSLFTGLLPCESREGRAALPLGKLAEFLQVAKFAAEQLGARRTPAGWADSLTAIVRDLICPDNSEQNLKILHTALQNLREAQESGGFQGELSLEAVRDCLQNLLDAPAGGYGFLGGRVTFCAMLPMRSIPFRVICMAGMNDGTFPRTKRQPSFSLMSGQRRRGDRSLRDEDRYLFLETLLAAGERLYISYTGQSDRDNSVIPPSVVISEVMDYVQRGFIVSGGDAAPAILSRHRLQAFSYNYFSDNDSPELFSFSSVYRDALQARQVSGCPPRRFIHEPLPDDPELLTVIEIVDLKRFLSNPAAFFLTRRMKIRTHKLQEELEECEPFTVDSLTAYGLRQELVRLALNGGDPADCYHVARARSLLPPLDAGRYGFAKILDESREFSARVAPLVGDMLEPLPVEFGSDGMCLTGVLNDVCSGRHLRWRCGTLKANDRLGLWVDHLILNALAPAGYPRHSLLVCSDLTLALAPLPDAAALLADLLALYREGLRLPLPFFPQVSWLYLTDGIEKAQARWEGSDHAPQPPQASDPACSLCFNDINPLDEAFSRLALRVFEPLRSAAVEEKGI